MQKSGFTFLEILLVLAVLAILGAILTTAVSNFRQSGLLQEAKEKSLTELNLARSQTLGSKENSEWGVHFETYKIVRFKGQSYSAFAASNATTTLPAGVKIDAISLGGPVDITFERLTGRASAFGIITFMLEADSSKTKTLIIYASGAAE